MESKFHRWWLGSCVAALLLASWVGGFSVAVTSVFVVIYLTGVTLIGPDDAPAERVDEPVDVVAAPAGYAASEPVIGEPEVKAAPEGSPEDDAEPYPDDEADATPDPAAPADAALSVIEISDAIETSAVVVETTAEVDTTAVVEAPSDVDIAAVTDTTTTAAAAESEPSPA